MKKNNLFLLIGILFLLINNATNAQWSLTGNVGTSPVNHFVGTTDALGVDLRFRTKNTERMRINGSTGKTAFASSFTPGSAFTYLGQVTVKGNGNNIAMNGVNPYLSLYESGTYKGYLWSRGSIGDIVLGTATNTGKIVLAPNYIDALVATSSGKIGIGNSSPFSTLDVIGSFQVGSPTNFMKYYENGGNGMLELSKYAQLYLQDDQYLCRHSYSQEGIYVSHTYTRAN
ncbi:MAG: hypothetical protein IPP29_18715 [Bacteroidetes bacterium]|nr:hypothetical protein [Bacteroidota bacterium]